MLSTLRAAPTSTLFISGDLLLSTYDDMIKIVNSHINVAGGRRRGIYD